MPNIISLPALSRNWDTLANVWEEVTDTEDDLIIDFTRCNFIGPEAVAILGALARLVNSAGRVLTWRWDTLQQKVGTNLRKNGFLDTFQSPIRHYSGNTVPYREDLILDKKTLVPYLRNAWLGHLGASPPLLDDIVGNVFEIYANAFEHAQSSLGTFTCGQYFPKMDRLSLSVVDVGIGIPANVRRFCRDQSLAGQTTMRMALTPSFSTRAPGGVAGGLGLKILRDFVVGRKGVLEIISHDGHYKANRLNQTFSTRLSPLSCTLVYILIPCG